MKNNDITSINEAYYNTTITRDEDSEQSPAGWLTTAIPHLKKAFDEAYEIGYGGDPLTDEQINTAVSHIIDDGQWGDQSHPAKSALAFLIKGFYELGVQDS